MTCCLLILLLITVNTVNNFHQSQIQFWTYHTSCTMVPWNKGLCPAQDMFFFFLWPFSFVSVVIQLLCSSSFTLVSRLSSIVSPPSVYLAELFSFCATLSLCPHRSYIVCFSPATGVFWPLLSSWTNLFPSLLLACAFSVALSTL